MRLMRSILALMLIVCTLAGLDSCSDSNCLCPYGEDRLPDPTLYMPLAVGNWWRLEWKDYGDDNRISIMTDSIVSYEALPFGGYCYQLAKRLFDYDLAADSVIKDTLLLNYGAYEVRDNCLYLWDWDYGIMRHDTIAYRLIDAPLEKDKEWDCCIPEEYVYVSDPAETLRTRCHGMLLNVKYRASVTVPAGTFPRIYEIWFSGERDPMWLAFAPGVGPVTHSSRYELIDYHVAE